MQTDTTINVASVRSREAMGKGPLGDESSGQEHDISGLRDLAVHLDGTNEDETRLAHAEWIAAKSGAHLTGIYTNLLPDYAMVAGDAGGTAAVAMLDVEERIRREGDLVCSRLKERLSRLGVANELRRLEHTMGGVLGAAAAEARWTDLFVATCPYRDNPLANWDELVETALFESGHGVYLVPPGSKPRTILSRVLVAWTDTREAARAVAEAMPFLRAASDVEIIIIAGSEEGPGARGYAAADIATHLDRQGVKVNIRPVDANKRSASEVLLEEVSRRAADLLVMGGYGHSRWREWIIGGTTREMLASADIPILMAH